MSILDKELHVLGNVDMDNNGSIVLDVKVEILKIFSFKSKSFDFFKREDLALSCNFLDLSFM